MNNSKTLVIYSSPLIFVVDVLILVIASFIDNHFNHGNFFNAMYAWRLGLLGMPLALCGIGAAIFGIKKANKFKKVVPLVSLVLCLLLTFSMYYEFVIANSPNLWGV
jgi:hypothetical protein